MKAAFVSIALLLLTSTSFASPPPDSTIFASLGSSGSCPVPMQAAASEDPGGGPTVQGTCTANCGACSVSCTGQSCWALDGHYVQCDGVNYYCPSSCQCQDGAMRWSDGGCCPGGYQKTIVQECISGRWEVVDTICWETTCF